MNDLARRWDLDAVRAGIGVCLILAIPLTLIAAFVDSDDTGSMRSSSSARCSDSCSGPGAPRGCSAVARRCSHGIVTAMVAYLGAQAVFITIRLIGGNSVNWFGVFFTLSLVMLAGLFGGLLGSLLQARGVVPSSRRSQT